MNIDDFIEAVEDGQYDGMIGELIPRLQAAINSRKDALLVEGARVRFNGLTSPQYMQGVEGVVTMIERGRNARKANVHIRFDEKWANRGRFGEKTRAPAGILDVIAPAESSARSVQP